MSAYLERIKNALDACANSATLNDRAAHERAWAHMRANDTKWLRKLLAVASAAEALASGSMATSNKFYSRAVDGEAYDKLQAALKALDSESEGE
jgi:hypothetical protein